MTRSLEEIQADKKALAEEEKQALKAHKTPKDTERTDLPPIRMQPPLPNQRNQ